MRNAVALLITIIIKHGHSLVFTYSGKVLFPHKKGGGAGGKMSQTLLFFTDEPHGVMKPGKCEWCPFQGQSEKAPR